MKRVCFIFLAAAMLLSVLSGAAFTVSADTEGAFEYTVANGEATVTKYTGEGGDVTIPSKLGGYPVTAIGEWAFVGCKGLTGIQFPDGVTEIGRGAFEGCAGLTSIDIPDSVTVIGGYAFERCTSLTRIAIGSGVTEIGYCALAACSSLESIVVSADNPYYYMSGNCLIEKETNTLLRGFADSVIPNGVTVIGECAFDGCAGLTGIVIPNSVTVIGENAFSECTDLTSIALPDSVTMIGGEAFYGCTGLTSVRIPDSVTTIRSEAFALTGLTSVEIPESVVTMGFGIFDGCEKLTDIYCLAKERPSGWAAGGGIGIADYTWLDGCKATVHWGEAMPTFSTGDLGGNGEIDATDYLLLKRFVLGTFGLTDAQKQAADVNHDGKINAMDYMLVKRHVLGTYVIG